MKTKEELLEARDEIDRQLNQLKQKSHKEELKDYIDRIKSQKLKSMAEIMRKEGFCLGEIIDAIDDNKNPRGDYLIDDTDWGTWMIVTEKQLLSKILECMQEWREPFEIWNLNTQRQIAVNGSNFRLELR